MSDYVLQTEALTKHYGSHLALDHLDLRIPRGCVYGFLGRNGAGKTTAIKLLLGLLKPTLGRGWLLGCDCQYLTPAVRQRVGYVAEGHRLFGWMTIQVLEGFQRSFFPRSQWDERLFGSMLDYFGLSRKRKIKQLSTGQRAQVSLALAIAQGPELLIMDDPTLGLDTAVRRQFLEGMIEFIQRQGRSILFSSHILSDVERVADRIAVIDRGVLRADCTLEEFRTTINKAVLTFTGELPPDVSLGGVVRERRLPNRLELTLVGVDEQDLRRWSESVGAAECRLAAMNLEDQFIDFTAPPRERGVFQWENSHDISSAV